MTTTSFNSRWTVRPKTSIFSDLAGGGGAEKSVVLPHDAQLATERGEAEGGPYNGYFPSGAFEYSKQFDVPEDWREKRVSVEFEGVYRDAMVYVNGAYAAQRPNGYSGFAVALDPFLRYGETNTIRVQARGHEDSRWYSGIGIYRDTWLVVASPVHIPSDGIAVTTPDIEADRAMVEVATTVVNASPHTATVELETVLLSPTGHPVATDRSPVTLRGGSRAIVRHRLLVDDPQLWDVDTPHLYRADSTLREGEQIVDTRTTSFGVRRLQLDPQRGLRINGATVKLRGACIHHDNGILGAAAFGRAEERRIELLKEAGFNAIRSAHNTLSRAMLDACDRHGMLVMDEAFDMWTESKSAFDYSLAFPEWWERDIEAMVVKGRNHPSVIFYSIGNEIPETGVPLGSELGRRLAEKVRSLDPTRFVTNGINGFVSVLPDVIEMMQQHGADGSGGVNAVMGNVEDFMNQISASELVTAKTAESFSVLDLAGMNYGDSRYPIDPALFPNRVIVGSETFPRAIDKNWRLVEENSHVIGDFTWTGWDYLGEVGIGRMRYTDEPATFAAPYPWIAAWCGDIDIVGYRRPQSYYREIVFGLRSQPYIAVTRPALVGRPAAAGQWSWTDSLASWTWDAEPGAPMEIEVYSGAAEVELRVDSEIVGREAAGRDNRFIARFSTPYRPGSLEAVAYDAAGAEVGRTELSTAAGGRLVITADRTELTPDHRDLAFVTIEIRDAEGRLVTTATDSVEVTVSGAGELIALGNGRPDNSERYDQQTHRLFDGRLLAVIRPSGAGSITVTASAGGHASQQIELSVRDAEGEGHRAP